MSLQYLKEEVRDEVDFLDADEHRSYLQIYIKIKKIKVSYKVIVSLLIGMISILKVLKVTSLQYVKMPQKRS